MKKLSFLVMLLLAINIVHAQIYKWADSKGNVHFSDQPHDGAEEINLLNSQVSDSGPQHEKGASLPKKPAEVEKHLYKSIAISQPENLATIRNSQGYVPVLIVTTPELKQGDLVQLLYDNQPLGAPQSTTIFALNNVKRGSHTVMAQLVDSNNNILIASKPTTFYMQRPRVTQVPGTAKPGV